MEKEKIDLEKEDILTKLDLINTDYYELEIENFRMSEFPSEEEMASYKRKKQINNQKIREIKEIKRDINAKKRLIDKKTQKKMTQLFINDFKWGITRSLNRLMENNDLRELNNEIFTKSEKYFSKLDADVEKELKMISNDHELEKQIKKVALYKICIDSSKYNTLTLHDYMYANDTYVTKIDSLISVDYKKDGFLKKIINGYDLSNDLVGKMYESFKNNCRVDFGDIVFDEDIELNEQRKNEAKKLGIDLKPIEELYEQIKLAEEHKTEVTDNMNRQNEISRKNNKSKQLYTDKEIKQKAKIEAVKFLPTRSKWSVESKLDKLLRVKEIKDQYGMITNINYSKLDELIDKYTSIAEMSVNIKAVNALLKSFSNTNVDMSEYSEIVKKVASKYERVLENKLKETNKLYDEYDIANRVKVSEEEIEKKSSTEFTFSEKKHDKSNQKSIRKAESKDLDKDNKTLEKEKTNKLSDERDNVLVEKLKHIQKYSDIRSPYYYEYDIYKRKSGSAITFSEFLKSKNDSNVSVLIELEELKTEILTIEYENFVNIYGDEKKYDVNFFKDYCENRSQLINKLGGLDNIIKESDLEDFMEVKLKKQKQIDDMFEDEKSETISNSKAM